MRSAAAIELVAALCGRLTRLGTVTCAGPVEIVSATALPGKTCAPAAGFWLITIPAGIVALGACVIAPTASPAAVIASRAAGSVVYTTLGVVIAVPARTISTAAMFQRFETGAVVPTSML